MAVTAVSHEVYIINKDDIRRMINLVFPQMRKNKQTWATCNVKSHKYTLETPIDSRQRRVFNAESYS
jgi:hypothetical protein